MTRLRIIGAGGHGKVVAEVAAACGYSDIAFLDQSWPRRTQNGSWPIVGTDDPIGPLFCAVGDNKTRARILQNTVNIPVLIHPAATVSTSAVLGAGTVLMAGAIVSADAHIGRGVILNTGCSVDHDCVLDDFVHISPGARLAGNVHIGTRSWIGIGAVILEGVHVGKDVIVAAGSAVINDLTDGSRVGGVPAKSI